MKGDNKDYNFDSHTFLPNSSQEGANFRLKLSCCVTRTYFHSGDGMLNTTNDKNYSPQEDDTR